MTDPIQQRRAPGQGTVQQLPSGRWRVQVLTADRRRIGGVYDTREEAEGVRRALVAKLAAANAAPTGGMTLATWLDAWLTERARDGFLSVGPDRSILRNRILTHTLGTLPLTAITRLAVKDWLRDMAEQTVIRRSKRGRVVDTGRRPLRGAVGRFRAVVRGGLAAAVERGLIPSNPAVGIKLGAGKAIESEWTYLGRTEVELLLGCERIPERLRLIYATAIYTGLRRGELWALRWSDVDLDSARPEVLVHGSHDRSTKTGHSRRVPLFPAAVSALRRTRELARSPAPTAFVFATRTGARRAQNDRAGWTRSGAHAGWRGFVFARRVPFHAFRHTCATGLLQGYWGTPWRLEDVRKMLGHRSIKITERYAQLSPEYLHERARGTGGTGAPLPSPSATPVRVPRAVSRAHGQAQTLEIMQQKSLSAVSIKSECSPENQANSASSPTPALGVHRETALALLRAVEAGAPAAPLLDQLAASVLESDLVRLALAVREGGPHRIRRGLDLAELILSQGADAADERSVRRRA